MEKETTSAINHLLYSASLSDAIIEDDKLWGDPDFRAPLYMLKSHIASMMAAIKKSNIPDLQFLLNGMADKNKLKQIKDYCPEMFKTFQAITEKGTSGMSISVDEMIDLYSKSILNTEKLNNNASKKK